MMMASSLGVARLDDLLDRLPVFCLWVAVALVPVLLSQLSKYTKHTVLPNLPVVGRKWSFEPLLLTRYRFVLKGWDITRDAWEKVSLGDCYIDVEKY